MTQDEREALVKRLNDLRPHVGPKGSLSRQEHEQTLDDAIAALTAPSAGEPVAVVTFSSNLSGVTVQALPGASSVLATGDKLYAAPPVTAQPAGEPVAVVRRSMTGGNAGLSRHVEITADFILNDGELLYTHPPAAPRSTRT